MRILTIEASTGRKSVAVATLLVHSVKVAISRHRMMAMAQGGIVFRGLICSPIHIDRPDTYRGMYNIKLHHIRLEKSRLYTESTERVQWSTGEQSSRVEQSRELEQSRLY